MTTLQNCWQRGIEPFLFFGELSAHRIDRAPLTEADRVFIRKNKAEIVREIKTLLDGERINFDQLQDDRRCRQ